MKSEVAALSSANVLKVEIDNVPEGAGLVPDHLIQSMTSHSVTLLHLLCCYLGTVTGYNDVTSCWFNHG